MVDDKEENRSVLQSMLEPLGFKMSLANDGQEIDLTKQLKPDCVLTDLVMPVKTGFEAVKEIRQIPDLKDTVIIAISASVLDLYRRKSRHMGCDDFLPKPVQEAELLAALQSHLQLEWIYEEVAEFNLEDSIASESPELPTNLPPEEVEILYELAMLGSMKKIRERAV